ncbi:hypothetical protein [Phormidium tenue]|uniref:Uncharacterized protein n=1 Tax=Phormidium tenue NIES-30 TaxID=549789 RepID=A0A1U7J9B1_9CYAN|nr:hypothetical protein [Phormidium tenue]MBD2230905.1 hypothetical protein [Phormidium tenue FACHB-1052]OKH50054.1 hypothetical protein NIES30_04935 [Phormidium tenue NIES-30]
MRVWALASCSGLLALAACSAEQSSSPNPSTAPPDGDAAEINTQPGLIATASSPMARPEVRPRQVIQSGYRLNPTVGRASTTARSDGQTIPQATVLRDRLQRLRSQQGARLSPSTSVTAAPQPAALVRPNLSQPKTEIPENPAFNVTQGNTFSTQGIAPLPTPSRPTPIIPEANPSAVNTPGFSSAALNPAQSASAARTYPIAPLGHQGYSTRPQQQAPVLTIAQAEAETASSARLHGGTLTAQQADPALGGTPIPQVAVRPETLSGPSSPTSAAAISNSAPVSDLRAASPTPAAQSTAHQSSGSVALTPTPSSVSQTSAADHQSQAGSAVVNPDPVGQAPVLWESVRSVAATGEAIPSGALPESLPLNAATPRPNLVPPQLAPSAANVGSAPRVTLAEEAAIAPSPVELTGMLPNPDAQPETAALRDDAAPVLHHQSQIGSETVHLIPTADTPAKGLPMAYCLSPSGQLLPTALEAQGSLASLPKFSSSSPNAPSLELGANLSALSKTDATELCMGLPASTPEPTTTPATPD